MIGIDPSLNSTGIAYWTKCSGDIVTQAIKVKNLRATARLMYVKDAVNEYLNFVMPEVAVYEDYAFGARGRATFDIGEMGGVLKTLCYEKGIDVLLVPPTVLKLFTTGKGNAKKEAMAESLLATYGREFDTDDEADAYALYKLGEAYYSGRKLRTHPQKIRESLKKCGITNGKLITS